MTSERLNEIKKQLKEIGIELQEWQDTVFREYKQNMAAVSVYIDPLEADIELMDLILSLAYFLSKYDVLKLYEAIM